MLDKILLSIATGWGPRHGGINSFNYDFLRGFAAAFVDVKVICFVPYLTLEEKAKALQLGIDLRAIAVESLSEQLDTDLAPTIIENLGSQLRNKDIVVVGHDVFTGALAIEVAKLAHGVSTVIHHMSYETYKGYGSGSSETARAKVKIQKDIFSEADIRLAVGPILRDELNDWFGSDSCKMIIPSLPEIEPSTPPSRWTTILFGRLNPETSRIKQPKLGIIGAARCEKDARADKSLAKKLRDGTRIRLFGGDERTDNELRTFIEEEIGAVLDVHILPYTESREELFDELRKASVALMPSWHEGFGLVGWEAIGAGVPVILGKDSGLYRFLDECYSGTGTGCVMTVDVRGSQNEPHYQVEDLEELVLAIKSLASDEDAAKKRALNLRKLLSEHSAKRCAEEFAQFVQWNALVNPDTPIANITHLTANIGQELQLVKIPGPTWHTGHGQSYSQLLRADEACVPYYSGTLTHLEDITNWAENRDYPVALRLYTGAGGAGKTRLLIEACRRLSENSWHAGFLTSENSLGELKKRFLRELPLHDRWFIVIDYAETRRDQLAALVELAQGNAARLVRVVLLARDAGEWWERLASDYPKCEQVFAGSATLPPEALPPLHGDLIARTEAYKNAIRAYAQRLGIVDTSKYQAIIPDLEAPHYNRPLYLQMAALLALHGERADSPNGLTDGVLRHEFRYWKALANSASSDDGAHLIAQLMAFATLTGGFATDRQAWDTLDRGNVLLPSKGEFGKVFRALCPLYPGRQGLQPLQPDILGEALVASEILSQRFDVQVDSVLGSNGSTVQREHALTVLSRSIRLRPSLKPTLRDMLVRNFSSAWREIIKVGMETEGPLADIACEAFLELKDVVKYQISGSIVGELKDPSLQWDRLALLASNVIVENTHNKLTRAKGSKRIEASLTYSQALRSRAISRGRLADYDEAFVDAKLALDELKWVTEKTATGNSDYAMALGNVSNRAAALQNNVEALEFSQRAYAIWDKLVQQNPKKYTANYCTVLSNLSTRHSALDNFELAFDFCQRALSMLQPLVEQDADRYRDSYAEALGNLSVFHGELGNIDESMRLSLKVVHMYKPLVDAHPDRYAVAYANSLINLSVNYSILEDFKSAISTVNIATNFLREIASRRPEKFGADYGLALSNLAGYQSETGDLSSAITTANENLSIFSVLIQKHSYIHQDSYLDALAAVATTHGDAGNFQKCKEFFHYFFENLNSAEKLPQRIYATQLTEKSIDYYFYRWLAGEKVDLASLISVVEKYKDEVISRRRTICSAKMLFVAGCILSSSSCEHALVNFKEFLMEFRNARAKDRAELLLFNIITLGYLATTNTDEEIDALAKQGWELLSKRFIAGTPFWIEKTVAKLNQSSIIP